jgi:hypothetical protein
LWIDFEQHQPLNFKRIQKLKIHINHKKVGRDINKQLNKLKLLTIFPADKDTAAKIAAHMAEIHAYDAAQSKLPLLDSKWVIHLAGSIDNCPHKDEIIEMLESLSGAEYYNHFDDPEISKQNDKHFLAWDIEGASWQSGYNTGHIGSYLWDIAAVITRASDPDFTCAFLESYIDHGGKKPTFMAFEANLYYMQVIQAQKSGEYESLLELTRAKKAPRRLKDELLTREIVSRLNLDAW